MEQGKVQKVYNTDGTLFNGIVNEVSFQDGVIAKKPKDGSLEYIAQLLEKAGIDSLTNENLIFSPEYDDAGKCVKLVFAGFKNVSEGEVKQQPIPSEYNIKYNDNSIVIEANNGLNIVFDIEGELSYMSNGSEVIFERAKPQVR